MGCCTPLRERKCASPKRWKNVLYITNGIAVALGLFTLLLGYEAYKSTTLVLVPRVLLKSTLALGATLFLIGALGCNGARLASKRHASGKRNWSLVVYFWIVFLLTLVQVGIGAVLFILHGVIQSSMAQEEAATKAVQTFNDAVTGRLEDNPESWKQLQTFFQCCGYDSTVGPLATGNLTCQPAADGTLPVRCKDLLLAKADSQVWLLAMIALAVSGMTLAALTAATCLLCCHTNETKYHLANLDDQDPGNYGRGSVRSRV